MYGENILDVNHLNKSYGEFFLKDVSFSLPKGYIMGFIGPNGAGKTTTIKSILNMVYPDSGEINLFGVPLASDEMKIKNDIGIVLDMPFYADEWILKDLERAISPFYKEWNHKTFLEHCQKFNLSAKKKIKDYSRGMKVKLMVAAALSHNAKLLILDEPTSGLDAVSRDELLDIFTEFISDEEHGILFSTHITPDLEKIADYITFILNGEIRFTGEKDQLLESYFIVKGGLSELSSKDKRYIIGYREHNVGFEGMILKDQLKFLPSGIVKEPISLDEFIVYMNREGKSER